MLPTDIFGLEVRCLALSNGRLYYTKGAQTTTACGPSEFPLDAIPVTQADLRHPKIVSQALGIVADLADLHFGDAAGILAVLHLKGVDLRPLLRELASLPAPITESDIISAASLLLGEGTALRPIAPPTPTPADEDGLPSWMSHAD